MNWFVEIRLDAVLTTGDNFYNNGVDNTSDSHWNRSFEDVFTGGCLLPITWYPSLGNHDARGNTQAQIDYSELSPRWSMPAMYYDFWLEQDSVSVHFIAVDTSPFVEHYHEDPSNGDMEYHVSNADTTHQLHWLDSVLGLETLTGRWFTDITLFMPLTVGMERPMSWLRSSFQFSMPMI